MINNESVRSANEPGGVDYICALLRECVTQSRLCRRRQRAHVTSCTPNRFDDCNSSKRGGCPCRLSGCAALLILSNCGAHVDRCISFVECVGGNVR